MTETIPKGYVGTAVPRREDHRLLVGGGKYAADLHFNGMVEATVLRSPVAHGHIRSIDVSRAQAHDGVVAIYTADDIEGKVAPFTRPFYKHIDTEVVKRSQLRIAPYLAQLLAKEKVYRVGEPIAIVVATDRYVAEDAAEMIEVDIDPLPALAGPEAALAADAPAIHDYIPDNIDHSFTIRAGDPDREMDDSQHRFTARFRFGRSVGSPMETRGVVAEPDTNRQRLTVWATTQRPHLLRTYISEMIGLPEEAVRVVAPDMGGSFGGGIYAEEILIAAVGFDLNLPVRWIEDRRENLGNARQTRDQDHTVEVGYDDDGRIRVLKDDFVCDSGVYNPFAITLSYNTAAHMRGQFKIDHFEASCRSVVTNKLQNTPVRGAGRPEAIFVMDRVVDMVALRTGHDPAHVRRLNLIPGEEMPYDMGMLYRDGAPVEYDSGNFVEQFDLAAEAIDHDDFRDRQTGMKAEGRCVGIGYSSHVEGSGFGPHEGAVVRIDGSGHVTVHSGCNPHGQSHETVLAQVCADALGVGPEDITVKTGDTSLLPHGGGTFASRSAVTAGSAVHMAGVRMKAKLVELAAFILEANADDLVVEEGTVSPRGGPGSALTFAELAERAAPGNELPPGMDPGLEVDSYFVPPAVTYSSGTHAAIVEVDPETGGIEILDYVIVDECGQVLNPMVLDGQQQGGLAHGVGNALLEEVVYDEDGQHLNPTFVDYLLPSACEAPSVRVHHQKPYLTPLNPIGVKGAGEGATSSAPAALANAIVDAMLPLEIEVSEIPITPARLRKLIEEARAAAAV
ncbi:MAG: molybdopterin-dependent oxidoreductase [Acidimicrobiia bacterium]|nr:molybdopterin-dependent oxidoreductase [Acidimicrobiia bacterium]